jgi:hypothetical protein
MTITRSDLSEDQHRLTTGRTLASDPLNTAEWRIQRILHDLERETGQTVDHVEVDTRYFARLRTKIHLV